MRYLFLLLVCAGCATQMSTETTSTYDAMEEVRIALLDVRKDFSNQKIDLQNLEDKVADLKPNAQAKIASLEARIMQLEKQLSNIQTDLHTLSAHAKQTTDSLAQYRNQITALDSLLKNQGARLDEIANLKSTLNSISQAIGSSSRPAQVHKVASGESLEKIARQYSVSIDALKKTNGLTTNTIMIGQELKIPE